MHRRYVWGKVVNRRFLIVLGVVFGLGVATLGYVVKVRLATARELQQQIELAHGEALAAHERALANTVVPTENRVPTGGNFAAALQKLGLTPSEAAGASTAA